MAITETLTEHLRTVLQVLQESQVEYALAGGLAYSALVEPRATIDIDLLIMLSNNSIQDFFGLLARHFASLVVHREPMHFPRVKIWRAVSFKNDRELILDFLLAESPFHQSALQRSLKLEFLGITLKVVTLEDLVLLKKCAQRPQDISDLTNIYAAFQDKLDHAYIEFWSQELKLSRA